MTEKRTNQNEEKWHGPDANHRPLPGKVVLLVGNDTAVLQILVSQLAQKGADIALLCRRLPMETSHKIKESVQSFGGRFLLLEQGEASEPARAQLIQTVTAKLGNPDIFIDLSAQKGEPLNNENGNSHKPASMRPNWQFIGAILKEIAHA
ncbi:MAG TPA: hypothetical protein PLD25_09310 [Chloroflexota bacterium]|nr:hypothetical protein [Chloroflexota bacterium]HUM70933.1 hypothetical protein [Chloroflexota bacterium]